MYYSFKIYLLCKLHVQWTHKTQNLDVGMRYLSFSDLEKLR